MSYSDVIVARKKPVRILNVKGNFVLTRTIRKRPTPTGKRGPVLPAEVTPFRDGVKSGRMPTFVYGTRLTNIRNFIGNGVSFVAILGTFCPPLAAYAGRDTVSLRAMTAQTQGERNVRRTKRNHSVVSRLRRASRTKTVTTSMPSMRPSVISAASLVTVSAVGSHVLVS